MQGRVLGITIGCILGMCPLLFMKYPAKDINGSGENTAEVVLPVVVAVTE